ncbi:unnamed protein product [Cuscuta epithymum]|uniref:Uncharacterized protein n=2 Tax=Cuscuta epithymum TaxID=186058 RepID=A0AAV0GEB3_9ASTE|nr:unnamed protein product [Cuscuta epithymum]
MSKLFEFSGVDDFCLGGPVYPNQKDSLLFLSLGHQADVFFPSRKRSRISAPFVFRGQEFQQKKSEASIDVLPDECLFEILRRLPGGQERSACAGVSKRWLMLLSTVSRDEITTADENNSKPSETNERANPSIAQPDLSVKSDNKKDEVVLPSNVLEGEVEVEGGNEDCGFLSRCLDGKKATDLRLASIALGITSRGGLGKLSIRGSKSSSVTDLGLKAIGRGCPSLKSLSLWNLSNISDEGLLEIASGCHLIEKLDLTQCPRITDKSLTAIAKNNPNLTSVTIESCLNIGNESLQSVGKYCLNLKSITVKRCPLIGDQGLASLFTSAGMHLTNVKLQSLSLSDISLAVIGHYGVALTDLNLASLQNINEKGFWVMGNGQGLQNLRSLVVASCLGVTDLGVEALGKGCPNLKQICFRKCPFLSDNGAVSLVKFASSLESLQLDECHRITQAGVFGILILSCGKLKALSLENCFGIKDLAFGMNPAAMLSSPCKSLRSLSISNCTGFNDDILVILGRICPNLVNVNISGLHGVTDNGLLPFVQGCDAGLVKVNLSGCVNVTDKTISTMVKIHGETLELLNLDGCGRVTDESLYAIAEHCSVLREFDVSKSRVSDSGIAALAVGPVQTTIQILSLSGCTSVSDKCLPYLCKVGSSLTGLNIQSCHGISQHGVDMLVERLCRCDILT